MMFGFSYYLSSIIKLQIKLQALIIQKFGTYHTAGMYICSASLGARGRRGRPACWQTGKGVFIKISATVVSWMY